MAGQSEVPESPALLHLHLLRPQQLLCGSQRNEIDGNAETQSRSSGLLLWQMQSGEWRRIYNTLQGTKH